MSWSFSQNVREAQAVTALPSSPEDGDQIIFMDSLSAPTYAWHFRYVAAKSSNKWQFIGGAAIEEEVATAQTIGSSGSYVALATAGPTVTVPLAGDYLVVFGCTIVGTAAAAETRDYVQYMSFDVGGTGAVDADAVSMRTRNDSAAPEYSLARQIKKTGLAASTALTSKYKASGGSNASFKNRHISVVPIAVGG